jgi:hypothetical protein
MCIGIIPKFRPLGLSILLLATTVMSCSAREISGTVVRSANELVPSATVTILLPNGKRLQTESGKDGTFHLTVPDGSFTVEVSGRFLRSNPVRVGSAETGPLQIQVSYEIAPIHQSIVISAEAPNPAVENKDTTVFNKTLFGRDDQIFHVLDAGINAGQHEGGGKSVEIRRFGFNLDHGGVSGGLKVLVDDIQQNQTSQGHGQGYLGQLKSLSPELIQQVQVVNGPFRAEYGDFSGLGVVHIRTRESLPNQYTLGVQGGAFHSRRVFAAFSPELKNTEALVAYEGSYTDGPFLKPLHYLRNNITGNITRQLGHERQIGFKFNFGTNRFDSSGQIPLDLVADKQLERFGYIDPADGGHVFSGVGALYFRQEFPSGDMLKVDGFLSRSLFDLWSNFTFYLNNPVQGDGIQQHDSRLQEGVNAQYLHAHKLFNRQAVLTLGGNFHDNQIKVGTYNTADHHIFAINSSNHVRVTNAAGYLQEGIALWGDRLYVEAGLRMDSFRFQTTSLVDPTVGGAQTVVALQPKVNLAYTPSHRLPLTLYCNYGRGISSQDARGISLHPQSPKVSITDFFQWGAAYHQGIFSGTTDWFLIDRSSEQVYVPDDGSIEFKGPSRSYGWEAKTAIHLTRTLALNGGVTAVSNAYYRGTFPRVYIDSAPHIVANAALSLAGWRGFSGSLRYHYGNHYRLTGDGPLVVASGFGVIDFSIAKQLRHSIELNLSIDNVTEKRFYETQNYFKSRVSPTAAAVSRIHATPGYPVAATVGLRFYLAGK